MKQAAHKKTFPSSSLIYPSPLYTAAATSSIKYSFVSVWQIFFIGERAKFCQMCLQDQNKSSSFSPLSWSIRSRGKNKWPRDLLGYFCGMTIVSTTTTKVVTPQKGLFKKASKFYFLCSAIKGELLPSIQLCSYQIWTVGPQQSKLTSYTGLPESPSTFALGLMGESQQLTENGLIFGNLLPVCSQFALNFYHVYFNCNFHIQGGTFQRFFDLRAHITIF